jgi:hypothetical protein
MTTIYIVQGSVPYEFTETIRAFTNEGKANEFVVQCENYDKIKIRTKDWYDAHPAGCAYYDYYEVEEVELE